MIEQLLDSPGFWFGILFIFMVIGLLMTAEHEPSGKKKK